MTAQRWPEDVGSVAEEAGRLLESLRRAGADAAASASAAAQAPSGDTRVPPVDAPRTVGSAAPADGAAPAAGFSCEDPVCQWCPVCRASAFVRRLSPETLDGLAELAGFAAHVLGDLAKARARDSGPSSAPPTDPSREEPRDA